MMKITGLVGLCDGNCKVKEKASVNHANAFESRETRVLRPYQDQSLCIGSTFSATGSASSSATDTFTLDLNVRFLVVVSDQDISDAGVFQENQISHTRLVVGIPRFRSGKKKFREQNAGYLCQSRCTLLTFSVGKRGDCIP